MPHLNGTIACRQIQQHLSGKWPAAAAPDVLDGVTQPYVELGFFGQAVHHRTVAFLEHRERCVAMRGAVGVGGALLRAKRATGGLHEAFKASRACGCLAARRHDRAARSASGGISESRQKCRPKRSS